LPFVTGNNNKKLGGNMFKKFAVILALAASLVMMSCSDDKKETGTKDSEAFTNSMTGTVDQMMAAPGAKAMEANSGVLATVPFGLPMKGVNIAFEKIESTKQTSGLNLPKIKYPESNSSLKQEDHFVFADHLGTYTCTAIYTAVDEETGETYVTDSDWSAVYGGNNITIIVPANLALDGKKFELVLHGYNDEFISWYDEYENYYYDYYPTFIDMDAFVSDVNVFALDFEGDWEYLPFEEEVMPVDLDVTLAMAPFSLDLDFWLVDNVMDLTMVLKKNNITSVSLSLTVTFIDNALEDIKELIVNYTVGNYGVEAFIGEEFIYYEGTMQGAVDMVNAGTNIYVKIKEGSKVIGNLKAKLVTVTDEYETYDTIVFYIKFNDGSQMTMEEFAAMFEGYEDFF
jgi:hypothetical protein